MIFYSSVILATGSGPEVGDGLPLHCQELVLLLMRFVVLWGCCKDLRKDEGCSCLNWGLNLRFGGSGLASKGLACSES